MNIVEDEVLEEICNDIIEELSKRNPSNHYHLIYQDGDLKGIGKNNEFYVTKKSYHNKGMWVVYYDINDRNDYNQDDMSIIEVARYFGVNIKGFGLGGLYNG